MPLVEPNKKYEEPAPLETPQQVVARKTEGFWKSLQRVLNRLGSIHMPPSVKAFGHDIWYGNLDRKPKPQAPLKGWRWLWDSSKPKKGAYAKPYTWAWQKYPKKRKR